MKSSSVVFVLALALVGVASPAQASPSTATAARGTRAGSDICHADPNTICFSNNFTFGWNQQCSSANRKANLVFQYDGNLVIYDEADRARWSSRTWNQGWNCKFQAEGNLVVYNLDAAIWSTGTWRHPSAYLARQGDGDFVIYDPSDRVLWSANTYH